MANRPIDDSAPMILFVDTFISSCCVCPERVPNAAGGSADRLMSSPFAAAPSAIATSSLGYGKRGAWRHIGPVFQVQSMDTSAGATMCRPCYAALAPAGQFREDFHECEDCIARPSTYDADGDA